MDIIDIKILEDGTLEIKTSAVSTGNHMSAEKFLKEATKLMGGQRQDTPNPEAKAHAHMHKHGVHHAHNH